MAGRGGLRRDLFATGSQCERSSFLAFTNQLHCLEPLVGRTPPRWVQGPNFVPAEMPQALPFVVCCYAVTSCIATICRAGRGHFQGIRFLKESKVQAQASSGLASAGTAVPKSEPGCQVATPFSLAGMHTAFVLPSDMAPHAATIKLRQAGSVSSQLVR